MSSEISEISKISEQLQSSQCGIIHDAPETVYEITPEMIEAELKWEDECSDAGYKYALAAAQHLVENRQAALTSAGVCLVSRNIVAVADHLSAWLKEMETKPGRKSLAAVCLNRINPLKAAAIALREMVNEVWSGFTLTGVSISVASALLLEIHCQQFDKQNPQLYDQIKRDLRRDPQGKIGHVRRRKITSAIKRYHIDVDAMDNREKALVGSRMIEIVCEVTGLFSIESARHGQKTTLFIVPSPEVREWVHEHIEQSAALSPMYLPTLIPPKAWTTAQEGGYYSHRMSQTLTTMRGTFRAHKTKMQEMDQYDLSVVFKAVNALQNVQWKVNRRVLETARDVWEKGIIVSGMPCRFDTEVGPKPDFATNPKGWAVWKRQATAVFIQNREWESKRNAAERTLMIATRLAEIDQFFMPYLLDFRGRIYAKPQFLNPQGSKLAKGLLTFAQGKPLGERGVFWLAVHVANSYGYDKASLEERVKWVKDNEKMILDCACEPLEFQDWTKADSPWEFLAACIEWSNYLTHGEGYICSLPISVDGKCNGLQHGAAALRDENCGKLVCLIPSDKPQDIYQSVCDGVIENLKKIAAEPETEDNAEAHHNARVWLAWGLTRGTCKKPVMILPYGGTKSGVRQAIHDHISEAVEKGKAKPEFVKFGSAVHFLGQVVWDTMGEIVVGPRQTMDWMRKCAQKIAEQGLPVSWIAPTGFVVHQQYSKLSTHTVTIQSAGSRFRLLVAQDTDEMDRAKQASAIAPNVVHSLDAAALMLTVNMCKKHGIDAFSCVHDSYGTLASDMDTLSVCLRKAFVSMYQEDVLESLRTQWTKLLPEGETLPEVPPKGTLDLEGVLSSTFFFS